MRISLFSGVLGCAIALAGAAQSATLFSEDFSDEATNYGTTLNFAAFDQFSVSAGTVDLINIAGFGITCQTTGCVDLDGSTRDSGLMSSTVLNFVTGVQYMFSATLSGNQRSGGPDSVLFGITNGVLSQTESFAWNDGYTTFNIAFTVAANTSGSIFFQDQGNDNLGVILDRVSVSEAAVVPLPASLPLILAGLGGLGLLRRRKST
ncbi:MAG: VPLPA-CTERM sorting domain-containing protein [Rhodobacteraceae bacterium]|nr:VPLPA-CTERM sorting domain-containing protein [Paracoccaceae bacterium]